MKSPARIKRKTITRQSLAALYRLGREARTSDVAKAVGRGTNYTRSILARAALLNFCWMTKPGARGRLGFSATWRITRSGIKEIKGIE